MADLTVNGIINTGFTKGLKNAVAIAVNAILWGLTIWIPYINVGTTIGLFVGLPIKASRDEEISYTDIFDPAYRKWMGEVFLVWGFSSLGVAIGYALFFVPGIVIAIAWSLSSFLVVDKEMNPTEALGKSNSLTYGKKWTIFGGMLVLGIIVAVVIMVVGWIFGLISSVLSTIIVLLIMAVASSVFVSAWGYVYKTLAQE